jgi:hypothetical protein
MTEAPAASEEFTTLCGPNIVRVDGSVAYLKLLHGQEMLLDTADLERAAEGRWHIATNGKQVIVRGYVAGRKVLLHHHLLRMKRRGRARVRIRHRNGNPLDNRRTNLEVLPQRSPARRRPRQSSTGVLNVWRVRRNGSFRYMVSVRRGARSRYAYFPDTDKGREHAEQQARAWRIDLDAALLYPPAGVPRTRRKPGALGAPGLTTWRDPRSGREVYRFLCQRAECPGSKSFPFSPEGLLQAQEYSRTHYGLNDSTSTVCENNKVVDGLSERPKHGDRHLPGVECDGRCWQTTLLFLLSSRHTPRCCSRK